MSFTMDLIWQDDQAVEYRANCELCTYRTGPCDDEDAAARAWLAHECQGWPSPR